MAGLFKTINKYDNAVNDGVKKINKVYPRPVVRNFTIGEGTGIAGKKAAELYDAILEKRFNKYEEEFSVTDVASGHSPQTYSALVLNGYLEKIKPNVFKISVNGFIKAYNGYIKLYKDARQNAENYLKQMESFDTKGLFSPMLWYKSEQEKNIAYAKELISIYNNAIIKLDSNFENIKKELLK